MQNNQSGAILVIGDSIEGFWEAVPRSADVVAFLTFTTKGVESAVSLAKNYPWKHRFESVNGTSNHKEFLEHLRRLQDFIEHESESLLEGIYVGVENFEAVTLSAISAHQSGVPVFVVSQNSILRVDFKEARLFETIREVVRLFNLHQYSDVMTVVKESAPEYKSSKVRTYFKVITELSRAYHAWDERDFESCRLGLRAVVNTVEENREDFGSLYAELSGSIKRNIFFLSQLKNQRIQALAINAIDALFSGIRRYEKGDNIVALITLANSTEFALRSRLSVHGLDVNDPGALTRKIKKGLGRRADDYFRSKNKFVVRNGTPSLGFGYKPGFVDMIDLLRLLEDDLANRLSGLVGDDESQSENAMSLLSLNQLRNKVVHNMSFVTKETIEQVLKISEVVIELLVETLGDHIPHQLLAHGEPGRLLTSLEFYGQHIKLNAREVSNALFQ